LNIYVAEELRDRMRRFDNRLNWSQIASVAFERAVDDAEQLDRIRHPMKRRLAVSRIEQAGGLERWATQRGMQWAENEATDIELRSLAAFVKRVGRGVRTIRDLAMVVCGGPDEPEVEAWPGKVIGHGVPPEYEATYTAAFVKAALAALAAADEAE
jgi:hypothetical protein